MTVLLRGLLRSGRESGRAGRRGRGLQEQMIGPVPPPLRRRTADRLPADRPLMPLHGPLREDVIPSERRSRPRAARGQPPAAPGAAAEPTGLAGSGRICPMAYLFEPIMLSSPGAGSEGWRHDVFSQVATGVR